jgi:hypothetical protein
LRWSSNDVEDPLSRCGAAGRLGPGLGLPPGDYVELSVSDQGVGLPKEDQERIFEPFFTTKPDGNGLGLTVAYSIARRHDGGQTEGASPDGGATFVLVLPAWHRSRATKGRDELVQGIIRVVVRRQHGASGVFPAPGVMEPGSSPSHPPISRYDLGK